MLGNNLSAIEQHVNWITDSIEYLAERDVACMEATVEAENEWAEHVNNVASATLFNACNSWYRGANVPGAANVHALHRGPALCAEMLSGGCRGLRGLRVEQRLRAAPREQPKLSSRVPIARTEMSSSCAETCPNEP